MRRFRYVLIVLLVLVMTGSVSGCVRNPVTGEQELSFMSRSEEIETGRKYYPVMTQMYNGELDDKQLQQYVDRLGSQLAKVSHAPDYPYEFNVVNTSVPNAYALPGGFITVTRGLLLEMTDESQLAAVLGHEIVHVTARHSAQQQTRSTLTSLLLTAGNIYMRTEGVAYAGLYSDLGSVGAQALLASYSRSQEKTSDRIGMRYMAKAGYDPKGMVELQRILLEERKAQPGLMQQIFASHPLSEDRIDYTLKEIEEVRKEIDIPRKNQLNRFDTLVAKRWKPRQPAYEAYDKGMEYLGEEKFDQAKQAFRTAISGYDGEALFHAGLGLVLTEQKQPKDGRSSLDKALGLNSDVFRIQLYSGFNHFELDHHENSLENLKRAEELLPGVPAVTFYQGRNHEELGDIREAAKAYDKYLQIAPKGPHADYCRARLREWTR